MLSFEGVAVLQAECNVEAAFVQEQLDCQPFSKAPRVPPAETPGIRKPHADTVANPASPGPKTAQLDIFVNSFIDNIIAAVKLELTAAAMTADTAPASVAALGSESSTSAQAEQGSVEADVQPIPASPPPAAAIEHGGKSTVQESSVQNQQEPLTEAALAAEMPSAKGDTAAAPAADAAETEGIVQELVQGMLDTVTSDVKEAQVRYISRIDELNVVYFLRQLMVFQQLARSYAFVIQIKNTNVSCAALRICEQRYGQCTLI